MNKIAAVIRDRYLVGFTAVLIIMLSVSFAHASAISIGPLSPSFGKVGGTVNIHGSGFASCNSISVTFGPVEGQPALVHNDKLIQFSVPDVLPAMYGVRVNCDTDSTFAGVFVVKSG